MRPSYDAEHPSSPTPIYDALYSEYRRLFRALPGDRVGEEDLRFHGFAVRDRHSGGSYPDSPDLFSSRDPYTSRTAALPQRQTFTTYAGQLPGVPQFVPAQQHAQQPVQQHSQQHAQQQHTPQQTTQQVIPQATPAPSSGQGWVATGYLAPATASSAAAGRHRSGLLSLPPGRSPEPS